MSARWCPDNFKEILKSEGRTTEWLAKQCGVRRDTISRYGSGHTKPSEPVKRLIAHHLNCSIEFLEGVKPSHSESKTKETA